MNNLLVNKIDFLSETLKIAARLDFWKLDPELNLLYSSSEKSESIYEIFSTGDCFKYLKEYIKKHCNKPLLLSNSIEMMWIATLDIKADNVCSVYMIGPSLAKELSPKELKLYLSQKNVSDEVKKNLEEHIKDIPVILLPTIHQYGTMLHYAVTGENVQADEFNYQTTNNKHNEQLDKEEKNMPKNQTWYFEQRAMEMITNGCLDYKEVINRLGEVGKLYLPSASKDYLRNIKNTVLSFITISTRAAIHGGLDPEIAYTIGQRYADSAELSETVSELVNINSSMYSDFIQRVNRLKQNDKISSVIISCKDYIDLHIEEKITLKDLAEKYNYSESRLAQKFKEETGTPINQFIREKRIDRAKQLLKNTNETIHEIGKKLGFCNTSYFVESFRDITGVTPGEYRQ